MTMNKIKYKFNENKIVNDIIDYINATYSSHYSNSKYQATEIIIDQGYGTGFCMGNILKYAQRYGKKNGRNKADLMKVIHYAIIQLSQDHYSSEGSKPKDNLVDFDNNAAEGKQIEQYHKFKSLIIDEFKTKQ